jgi:hypothetical protein
VAQLASDLAAAGAPTYAEITDLMNRYPAP